MGGRRFWIASAVVCIAVLLILFSVTFSVAQEDPLARLRRLVPVSLSMPTPDALDPFFEKLLAVERGDKSRRIAILQIGDSHTANEFWSGAIRSLLAGRFGDAGRGMILPGKVHKYYIPSHMKVEGQGKWRLSNSLYHKYSKPIGLSGYRVYGEDSEARLSFEPKPDSAVTGHFSRFWLDYLVRPGNGTILLSIDGNEPVEISTNGQNIGRRKFYLRLADAPHSVSIAPKGDGRIDLFSATMERDGGGIIYEAVGVGGTEVGLLSRLDQELFAEDLKFRSPSLVILEFGTNEAYYKNLPDNYEGRVRGAIEIVRAGLPGVPIVVVGPPDAGRLPKGCKSWAAKEGISPNDLECKAEPSPLYTEDFGKPGKKNCYWFPALHLEQIRRIQQKVAFETGCAYWQWAELMQGDCGIARWMTTSPPLADTDHVHLTKTGYEVTGRAFHNALLEQYGLFKKRKGIITGH